MHYIIEIFTWWLFWPHRQSSNLLFAHIDSFSKLVTQVFPQSLTDCFPVHLQLVQLDPFKHLIKLNSHRRAQSTLSNSLASLLNLANCEFSLLKLFFICSWVLCFLVVGLVVCAPNLTAMSTISISCCLRDSLTSLRVSCLSICYFDGGSMI